MAKPNYQFEKRQKELEKKKKQEQKRLRKLAEHQSGGEAGVAGEQNEAPLAGDAGDGTAT